MSMAAPLARGHGVLLPSLSDVVDSGPADEGFVVQVLASVIALIFLMASAVLLLPKSFLVADSWSPTADDIVLAPPTVTIIRALGSQAEAPAHAVQLVCPAAYVGGVQEWMATFLVAGDAGKVISWRIDYGDGVVDTASTAGPFTHAYSNPGLHLVTLTTKANGGPTITSSCLSQWIWLPKPT